MSEREQRRPGDRFRATEEGPDQLRKIAQALLQAAEGIGVDAQTPVDCGEPAPTCPRFGVGEDESDGD